MSLSDITKFSKEVVAFYTNPKSIYKKVLYKERIIPMYFEGLKNAYYVYESLSKPECTMDKELKSMFLKLTKILAFLYDKELVNIRTENDLIPLESLQKILLEVEELKELFNNELREVCFEKLKSVTKKEYERDIEKVLVFEEKSEVKDLENEDIVYATNFKEIPDYIEVFNAKDDIKTFGGNNYMCVVPIVTGNYETDKSLVLLEIVGAFSANKGMKNFTSKILNNDNIHIEIAYLINHTAQTLVYLKNSHSLRENKLFSFDESEYLTRIKMIEIYIDRAKMFIEYEIKCLNEL